MRLQAEETINRTPSEVFAFVARDHFQNHPRWDPSIVELVQTSPGSMGVGATARLVRQDGNRRSEGTMEVTEYEPDRSFATVSRFGPFVLDTRCTCEPAGEGRTHLVLSIDTAAHGFVRLLLPVMKRTFRRTMNRSLQTIKEAVEAHPSRSS